MKYFVIILLAIYQSIGCYGQEEVLYSCLESDGWCGTYLKIYTDSNFVHTVGCEHMQSIQVGKMKDISDTLILKKYDLKFENFIDSIVFIENDHQIDTIDVFCFDNFGNTAFTDDDFIIYKDSSNKWLNNPALNRVDFKSPDISSLNRGLEYYKINEKFPGKENFYYSVDDSYLISTDKDLVLILKDLYNWSRLTKIVNIPRNTRFIKIYYHLPSEITSLLNRYSVGLDHEKPVINGNCENRIIRIE